MNKKQLDDIKNNRDFAFKLMKKFSKKSECESINMTKLEHHVYMNHRHESIDLIKIDRDHYQDKNDLVMTNIFNKIILIKQTRPKYLKINVLEEN